MILYLSHIFITNRSICTLNHSINQVQMLTIPLASFHRTSGYKHSRNIQSHSSHQHARSNLITITDTNHCICLMRIYHIFYTIGYNITAWQRIEHTIMSHCNTIIHRNRIEFSSKTTKLFDFCFYLLTDFVQMRMSRYKLSK